MLVSSLPFLNHWSKLPSIDFLQSLMQMQDPVVIIGAGAAGLATAACLSQHSIPNIIFDREDCSASLWKKYCYDRLHLHLGKRFCQLPLVPFPASYPNYVPRDMFIKYLDDYASHFNISPMYKRCVELACYDEGTKKWNIKVRNLSSGEIEEYSARFLVVATGEATDPFVPEIEGLSSFSGEVLHSTQFKNGKPYKDKKVLVFGSGNSGMEIALDLANHGAKTSIAVRSPVHFVSREMSDLALTLFNYLPYHMVDSLTVMLSKLFYGNMSTYGIERPKEGPYFLKDTYGKYPVVDVGTYKKIKSGEIQVLGGVESIRGSEVIFKNGMSEAFDSIVFCTGFKRSTNMWLKGDDYLLGEDGIPRPSYPNHWKGKNGLYCVGLSRKGFYGISADALHIADDIHSLL